MASPTPNFPYKHILLIGGTSGIGLAMANQLIASGHHVTITGRRQDRLDQFVSQHGAEKASSIAFDIADTEKAPEFAKTVMQTYPTLTSIFLNAGTQHHHDFSDPASVDLKAFNEEMHINYTSYVALVHAFLPHLLAKDSETSFIFTTSTLAIVPTTTLASYCASKAALNVFVLCLRNDLQNTKVKIIELAPPLVQSELHDYMTPAVGRALGMPAAEFATQAYDALSTGTDTVIIGSIGADKEAYDRVVEGRRKIFEDFAVVKRKHMANVKVAK